ncbi:MAG: PAS domain S-box protein, partial [Elusimicrobia bacterium]|nr:PAS domain S-box protein [Elusimicrobiota bacterium]
MAISAKTQWPVPKATPHPLVYLSTHYIQAKEYLEAIVEATSDAICTTDMAGRVIFFSPGAERMTG